MSNSWPKSYGLTSSDGQPSPLQPYTELQTEHTYLLNALNIENQKAKNLLRQIPNLEHFLLGDGAPSQKRKTRKQLGWLKHRFEEASRQERTILQRLGQPTWELQQMERLRLLEEERRNVQQGSWNETKFNPTVPEFCPQQMDQSPTYFWHGPGVKWQIVPWQQPYQYPYSPVSEEYTHEWSPSHTRDNRMEAIPKGLGVKLDIEVNYNATPESLPSVDLSETSLKKRKSIPRPRSNSMDDSSESSIVQARRRSLPSLPDATGNMMFWKDAEEIEYEEEESKDHCNERTYEGVRVDKVERLQRDSGYEENIGEYVGFYIKV